MRRVVLFVVVCLVVCFLYVWPGVWRYKYSGGAVRMDKLTGHRYIYNPPEKRWRDEQMMLEHLEREREHDRLLKNVEETIAELEAERRLINE